MQIRDNNYSIAEIYAMLDRRDLHINRDYQRGSGLWPVSPRSYFIDTIIHGFPFPKIYFYEYLDTEANGMRLKREIVDGQQRITTIIDFINDGFSISKGHKYEGLKFSQLEEEIRRNFMAYTVSVDVIRDASQAEIVEMFRRMNAYTLPLNDPEKRHAAFQGEFKWFVNRAADEFGEFFHQFGIFNNRQMVRMLDQELIAESYVFTKEGIISSSPFGIRSYYSENDKNFEDSDNFHQQIKSSIDFITANLPDLRGTHMMKPYAFLTLLTAILYNRYGPNVPVGENHPISKFANHPKLAQERLLLLSNAHEAKELDGPYKTYVQGCISGTNRIVQRQQRFDAVLAALQL